MLRDVDQPASFQSSDLPGSSDIASTAVGLNRVTVVVPVRNEEAHIEQTLSQVLQQQNGPDVVVEILVVDGRSDDRTPEIVSRIAEKHASVRLLDNPDRLSSSARNVGIENATGKYIVIIDGHCDIPGNTYFADHVNAFEPGKRPFHTIIRSPERALIASAGHSP